MLIDYRGSESMYSDLLAGEQNLYQWILNPNLPTSLLQASDIHLHPIVEGEDGGSSGGVAPLFYVADGLIEVFPTREASNRRVGGT